MGAARHRGGWCTCLLLRQRIHDVFGNLWHSLSASSFVKSGTMEDQGKQSAYYCTVVVESNCFLFVDHRIEDKRIQSAGKARQRDHVIITVAPDGLPARTPSAEFKSAQKQINVIIIKSFRIAGTIRKPNDSKERACRVLLAACRTTITEYTKRRWFCSGSVIHHRHSSNSSNFSILCYCIYSSLNRS